MGVKGLWQLLAIASRYVRLEELQTQRLAVDISLWLTQFAKIAAQQDSSSTQDLNQTNVLPLHIAGMLRRISKLLFLGIRPVFVYDGPAPSLKRTTLAARRRQREDAAQNFQRAAERLLLKRLQLSRIQTQGGVEATAPAEDAPPRVLTPEEKFWEEARAAAAAGEPDALPPVLEESDSEESLIVPDLEQLDEATLTQLPLELQKRILRQLRSRAQYQMHARILDSVVQDHQSRALAEAILDPYHSLRALQARSQSSVQSVPQGLEEEPDSALESVKNQTFPDSKAFDEDTGISHQLQARRRNLPAVHPSSEPAARLSLVCLGFLFPDTPGAHDSIFLH